MEQLRNMIRSIPDFPSQGIIFRDITTVLKEPEGLVLAIDAISDSLAGLDYDIVIGPESRGFIFGVPLAYKMKKGFVPARKVGKLPAETIRKAYALEYGTAEIELHKDALKPGSKIVIADDLLATGGTAKAIAEIVEEMGAEVVAMSFLIELTSLGGREVLERYNIKSILTY